VKGSDCALLLRLPTIPFSQSILLASRKRCLFGTEVMGHAGFVQEPTTMSRWAPDIVAEVKARELGSSHLVDIGIIT
jgi:hypothetical protein